MGATNYSTEDIERALTAVAIESGSATRARRLLEREGKMERIPPKATIEGWIVKHTRRYAEIRAEVLPSIRASMAEVHTSLANTLAEIEAEAAEHLKGEIDQMSPKDRINLVRNFSIASGVHIDKAAILRGEPTAISETRRGLPEIARALASKGVVIQGIAEEITDKPELTPPQSRTPQPEAPDTD